MNSLSFFLHWLSDPAQVGALAPSGAALAGLITAEIRPECAPVIELGPGTGAFTRALIERGIPENRLVLVEESPRFSLALRKRFPSATVLCADAAKLGSLELPSGGHAGAVVSGLPLLLMPPRQVAGILRCAFKRVRPGGAFYQFTYGGRSPVPATILEGLGLTATRIGRTLANIPPATVYRIERKARSFH
jgi:phosphatidylethanolamine/phosphatidyl-N-methylethanolamine N-methyltransferase